MNSPGAIDADYRGEIFALLINLSDTTVAILPGGDIGMLTIAPVVRAVRERVDALSQTPQAGGGFGSTGV